MRSARHALAITCVALTTSSGLGCWAVAKRSADQDKAPVVNTGAGATVIYPGQSAPMHPGNYHPREAGYGQGVSTAPGAPTGAPSAAPAPRPTGAAAHLPPGAVGAAVAQAPPEYASGSAQGSHSGSAAGSRGGNVAMLGGAEQEITKHIDINEQPKWLKYAALPFAVVAAPFKYGYEKLRGEPEAGPAIPRNDSQPRPEAAPPRAPTDYESARLKGMERELAQRSAAPSSPHAPYGSAAAPRPAPRPPQYASIADELQALRQRAASQALRPAPAPAPSPQLAGRGAPHAAIPQALQENRTQSNQAPPSEVGPTATGQVDRDGDGRPDHWIERRAGIVVAERFDDDFDARADRTLIYDPQTRDVIRIEEDTDRDGRFDSWTSLRLGQVSGRRLDDNGDGQVDSWSHYRGGVITRLERDVDGDGFRDHVAFYRDGRLDREERDEDSDGMTDLIKYYDSGERVERVEEDADGDGEMDVISYYEGGRLARREVRNASILETP